MTTRKQLRGQIQVAGGPPRNVVLVVYDDSISQGRPSTLADDATPSVLGGNLFVTGGTTAITDFDDGVVGQTIRIKSEHSVTITNNANIVLSGGVNYAMTDTDTLVLTMYDDGVWYEDSRSVN